MENGRGSRHQRHPDDLSDTSSRDYPRLYLESDYGQRTDREADFETEHEGTGGDRNQHKGSSSDKYGDDHRDRVGRGRY